LEQLRKENIRGLVLDLRDNGGGSLRSAVDICDMLVPKGEIVTTRGREGQILRAYRASGKAPFADFPIAVLVNRHSASASEILAACLQDNGRAIVVGQRSFGKGTVQEVIDMGSMFGAMKLTIATYWRPSGENINRPKEDAKSDVKNATWGVSPNDGYEVLVEDEERERLLRWQQEHELAALSGEKGPAGDEVPDRVLLKAIEYLESKAKQ
jgi:carboxyl-terminal processing protease